ncbi:hypothetical protein OF83DRAFT_1168441 [Amylostereum chailletii]|nr:hypothetical protein OF83DRAFT_1168441 [Amylostereum chailletii]
MPSPAFRHPSPAFPFSSRYGHGATAPIDRGTPFALPPTLGLDGTLKNFPFHTPR